MRGRSDAPYPENLVDAAAFPESLCGMAQFDNLPPDQLLERAQQLRELGELWRYAVWELADALEALAQEKRQRQDAGSGAADRDGGA